MCKSSITFEYIDELLEQLCGNERRFKHGSGYKEINYQTKVLEFLNKIPKGKKNIHKHLP